jgi:exopolysaccharide biosynthesis polyprenyl glycosylphosphotransferase
VLFEDSGTGRISQERRERERPPLGKLWNLASSRAIRARPGHGEAAAPALLVIDRELGEDEALAQGSPVARTPLHVVDDRMQAVDAPAEAAFPSIESVEVRSSKGRERLLRLRAGLLLADVGAALTGAAFVELVLGLSGVQGIAFAATAVGGWCVLACALGLYSGSDVRTWSSGVSHAPRLLVTALLLSWPLFAVASSVGLAQPAAAAVAASAIGVLASGFLRALVRVALHRRSQLRQRTLIIGSGEIAGELVHKLRTQRHFGLDPIGFVDDDPHFPPGTNVPYCGSLDELSDVLDRHAVDRVIIAFTRSSHEQLLRCIRTCRDRRVRTEIVPRLFELLDGADGMAHIGGLPLISITVPTLSPSARAVKRTVDVVVAGAAIIVLSPLLALIALGIKLETRGSVLFRQERMGRAGRTFFVMKFRSMYEDAEARKRELQQLNDLADGIMFKIHEDPRITRFGRFLRQYSLDELPQLFNVLRGEMSLVGPRPLILDESDVLMEDWHARRLDLRPGITGPWQVRGRSDLTVHDMVRFDYAYVSGWSLARDFEILLATAPAVLSGRGAY